VKISSAEFLTSAVGPDGYPDLILPEIAFVGRSNVGKSSLINRLVQRKKLAKTSSTPGKTRMINFYLVNNVLILVDLPGYGYTKAPEHVSRRWRKSIDTYFRLRPNLKGVFQLVDSRHVPGIIDRNVCRWLVETNLLRGICVVKTDKIARSKVTMTLTHIREHLDLSMDCPVVACSSQTGEGRNDLWEQILRAAGLINTAA
jgi:GTP-binding protein